MLPDNQPLFSAGAMTGTLTGSPILLKNVYLLSIQLYYTGSPVGTMKLQASCDPGDIAPTHWTDVTSVAVPTSDGFIFWNYPNVGWRYARVVYTFSSGSGTLDGRYNIKSF